jgi:rod shape determining protein RodA
MHTKLRKNYQSILKHMDYRFIFVVLLLMTTSLVLLSAIPNSRGDFPGQFFSEVASQQLKWFILGWGLFFAALFSNYNYLREYTWVLYLLMLLMLVGLFFTSSIGGVHRWYRIPLLGMSFQPSEFAKLVVVVTLSWFLERQRTAGFVRSLSTAMGCICIVCIPFILILKQPDLGSALILYPMMLVICYFGGVHPLLTHTMMVMGALVLVFVLTIFSGLVSFEAIKPLAEQVLKEYQLERLNPQSHHQLAAANAIAVGGIYGNGWRMGTFTVGGYLPAATTDSVFPAFGDFFGILGLIVLLCLLYILIHLSFQISAAAKDSFGTLLSAGIAVYIAMHVVINVGMMCGILPITGVPLVLISYGGSSVLVTMAALGLLQSVYVRRYTF